MNRTQKLKLNINMSLLSRIVTTFSGLIIPRLVLVYYGSETNGLVNSIMQFLGIITFLDLGVGSVVKSALYHPLSKKDNDQISAILSTARDYFQKIAYILVIYVIGVILFYPLLIDSDYSYLSIGFLITSMSISHFGRYYFGIVNELLLGANQQDYIQIGSEIVVVLLNLIISIILILRGASIGIVQLGSGLIYLIRPLFLSYYVNKNFSIKYNVENAKDSLPQMWSGMGQHIAYTIQNSTDLVLLTVFSSLENVSVYAVYNLVISAIKSVIHTFTSSMGSFFGSLYANNEIDLLNKYFDRIEWFIHTLVIYLYGLTAVLINSFVELYTAGVEDALYYAPIFSMLMVISGAVYSLRLPYQSLVFSAGHFKQTQMSSYIEAGLNIVISISLVNRLGLIGVAIGTLVSNTFRILYLVLYLSKNIVYRSINTFIKNLIVDLILFIITMKAGNFLLNYYSIVTFNEWIILAIILGIKSLILFFVVNLIFYKENIKQVINIKKK